MFSTQRTMVMPPIQWPVKWSEQQDRRPHWQAPTLLMSCLLAGVALSIGHHGFYSSLDGCPVSSDIYHFAGRTVSQQQINIAAGTALAFLVNSCLTTAVGIAYVQVFWRAVRGRTLPLSALDILYAGRSSAWRFLSGSAVLQYPLLALLSLLILLLPIASILTPATLSVALLPVEPRPTRQITDPRAAFASLAFISSASGGLNDVGDYYNYAGPQPEVRTIAATAAAQGSILPLDLNTENVSWQMSFPGPSLECQYLDFADMAHLFLENLATTISKNAQQTETNLSYSYIAGIPSNTAPGPLDLPGPFADTSDAGDMRYVSSKFVSPNLGPMPINLAYAQGQGQMTVPLPDQPASFYIGAFPTGDLESAFAILCELRNATYTMNVSLVDSTKQDARIVSVETHNPVPLIASYYAYNLDTESPLISGADATPRDVDQSALQRLSFQAVMEAFGTLFIGYWATTISGGSNTTEIRTQVQNTILLDTDELMFLQNASTLHVVADQNPVLSPEVLSLGTARPKRTISPGRRLSDVVEELFQNITVSMWSSPNLRYLEGSPFEPPPINVTSDIWRNSYVYASENLWIAYSISTTFTMVASTIGLYIIFSHCLSFGMDFSTIFRATRQATFSADLQPSDIRGEDPLPPQLSTATLEVGSKYDMVDTEKHKVAYERVQQEEGQQSGLVALYGNSRRAGGDDDQEASNVKATDSRLARSSRATEQYLLNGRKNEVLDAQVPEEEQRLHFRTQTW